MDDYIFREAAIETLIAAYPLLQADRLKQVLEAIPAADVRPVVFCKNCKYSYVYGEYRYCSSWRSKWDADYSLMVEDDDFCFHGADMKGEADGKP